MIIDGHAHACGELLNAEGILRTLDENGVDKIILVPGQHQSGKTYGLPNLAKLFPNREVANATNALTKVVVRLSRSARYIEDDNETVHGFSQTSPDRILQFYWVMLRHGFDSATVGARFRSWRFKGLKVHQCWDDFDIKSDAFDELAHFAVANGLPVFVHLDGAAQAAALAELAARRPGTIFIVGHLYGVERFVSAHSPLKNVYFDISCPDLVSDARLKLALDHFGPERLMLGSDSPYGRNNLSRGIERIRALGIGEGDKELMLGGNIARLLWLSAAG